MNVSEWQREAAEHATNKVFDCSQFFLVLL